MNRRKLLVAGSGAVVGLSGCLSRLSPSGDENGGEDRPDDGESGVDADDSEGSESSESDEDGDSVGNDPEAVLEAFYTEIYSEEGTASEANSYLHEDAELPRMADDTVESLSRLEYEIQGLEQVSSGSSGSDETVTFEYQLVISSDDRDDRETTVQMQLRTQQIEEGDEEVTVWRLYQAD